MTTTLTDIHPDIIQTHILPRLDGPSLSTTATSSSYLNTLCSDHTLWSHISRSTWPSITHPRVNEIISTFPSAHRSFYDDSFPSLLTDVSHLSSRRSWSKSKSLYAIGNCHFDGSSFPCELISAVDIRYQNEVVYSTVTFTETRGEFLSSPVRIELTRYSIRTGDGQGISRCINLTEDCQVDVIVGADKATVSHLKNSITLNWILIDPVRKRACNLSSMRPVSARADWVTNETHIRFVTVLPGCEPGEMVQCKIHVILGLGEGGMGLEVKEVMMKLKDLDSCSLNGMEFLVVIGRAIMEENNVRRRVVDEKQRLKSYKEFKLIKREKKLWVKRKQRNREIVVNFSFVAILLSFFISFYLVFLWE